ncbi:MAG: DUF6600 domain-containing protein [Candidatus Sulfotelmatobacter sp.]
MNTHKQWWSWAIVVASLAFTLQTPLIVMAQDAQGVQYPQGAPNVQNQASQDSPDANTQDPSSRVARLDFMEGSVSLQPSSENDWIDAVTNRPLVTGDNLWTDVDSKAEVHIGSTALRLGSKTGITLLEVSDHAAQIRLAQGSLIVKVRHVDAEDSYEIDTPNIAFVVAQPGDYRIDVSEDGSRTDVTVWRGRGEVTGSGSSYTLAASQYASFTGSDQLDYQVGQLQMEDGFDTWALERDRAEDQSDSANYVSRDMTGYEDLDTYGSWSYVAGYGMSWRPAGLAVGWAPYRFGHWAWVGPWGWTWVEDEPWGFAPFHYGRWAFAEGAWLWVPGPRMVRPVYAPALVAWVGGAPGFRFSAGAGVGWFPLAPGEVFVPGYRVSRSYVNRVNVTNTAVSMTRVTTVYNGVIINRNVNDVTYANRGVNGGVTVVSRDTFVNARPVARNVFSVPERELAMAPVAHVAAVEPVRASFLGAGRLVATRPPAAAISRPVVALRTPAGASQSSSLVRQVAPGRPVAAAPVTRQSHSDDGFRSFDSANDGNGHTKTQPRVWEAQGTPEPERSAPAQSRNRSVQAKQPSRVAAKPATPVRQSSVRQQPQQEEKYSSWHQQTPAATSAQKAQSSHSTESHASPAKK